MADVVAVDAAPPANDAVALDAALLRAWPLTIEDGSDKFERGSVLVVGGSASTPGAVELAGIAALRAGAGRLQLATVASARPALAIAVPEARVDALGETEDGSIDATGGLGAIEEQVARADALVLGCGMTDARHTAALIARLVPLVGDQSVVVIDAQGLACLADLGPDVVACLHGRLVLTPNRGECRRLALAVAGEGADDRPNAEQAAIVADRFGAVVSVFGHVAAPDGRAWCDDRSVVGLATSGSGDVLAGLIGGVAAACGDAAQAACWGTFAHLSAGASLATGVGPVGFLAREIAAEAAAVLADVSR